MPAVSYKRMKITHFFPVIALLLLAACSSGSSDETASQASTNTEPAETNGASDENAMPNDDETGNPGSETIETNENTVAANMPDTVVNNVDLIDTDSGLGQLHDRIRLLARTSLTELNTKLSQGELLSPQENECLGPFDPALGEPLLNIDCLQALSVSNSPIYIGIASLTDTPLCRDSILNNQADGCELQRAELTVNTLWFVPEAAPGQPERPQPKAGAYIAFDIVPNQFSLRNLDAAVSGVFNCEFDLLDGALSASSPSANCDDQARRVSGLIDEHLANSRL